MADPINWRKKVIPSHLIDTLFAQHADRTLDFLSRGPFGESLGLNLGKGMSFEEKVKLGRFLASPEKQTEGVPV